MPLILQRSGACLWSWHRDEKQRQRIRNQLRRSVHSDPVVAECALAALPNRDIAELHAGSVKQVRRVVNAARRRVSVEAPVNTGASEGKSRVISRPIWFLRERHRPAVIPALVEPEPPPRSLAPMSAILVDLEAMLRSGKHRYWALDWLHSVSGLDWAQCAGILGGLGVPVDDGAVKMITIARAFWNQLAEFRRIHANAVRLGQVEAAEGAWAFVEAAELPDWLPGLHVPKMHRRKEYLVRLIHLGRPLGALDFHGTTELPLFTAQL